MELGGGGTSWEEGERWEGLPVLSKAGEAERCTLQLTQKGEPRDTFEARGGACRPLSSSLDRRLNPQQHLAWLVVQGSQGDRLSRRKYDQILFLEYSMLRSHVLSEKSFIRSTTSIEQSMRERACPERARLVHR